MSEFFYSVWDFLNSSSFWGVLAFGGLLWFFITYFRTEKLANEYRYEVQQKLVNGYAFMEYFNSFKEDIYAIGKDEKKLVTGDKTPISMPEDKPLEIVFRQLTAESQIPSLGYAVICENADIYSPNDEQDMALGLFFMPKNAAKAEWKVISADNKHLVCEHPLMGEVTINTPFNKSFCVGDIITLMSVVSITYSPGATITVLRYEVLC